jgi:hypothetical protein
MKLDKLPKLCILKFPVISNNNMAAVRSFKVTTVVLDYKPEMLCAS